MEPQQLTTAEWAQIGNALKMLWIALGAAIFTSASLVTAHAIIPSALSTNTISRRWAGMRRLFYAAGVCGLVALGVFLALAALQMSWLRIYERFWQ